MPRITYFVALPIVATDGGGFAAFEAVECRDGDTAKRRALTLAAMHGGAVAFSRAGDPGLGDFDDAVILGRFGALPDDLTDLLGE